MECPECGAKIVTDVWCEDCQQDHDNCPDCFEHEKYKSPDQIRYWGNSPPLDKGSTTT